MVGLPNKPMGFPTKNGHFGVWNGGTIILGNPHIWTKKHHNTPFPAVSRGWAEETASGTCRGSPQGGFEVAMMWGKASFNSGSTSGGFGSRTKGGTFFEEKEQWNYGSQFGPLHVYIFIR